MIIRSLRSGKNAQTQTLTGKLQDDAKNRDTVFYLIIYHHPVMQRPAIYANALQTTLVIDVSDAKGGDILETLFEATPPGWDNQWEVGAELAGRHFYHL